MSWQQNYGCMIPGSLCHTWTVTNGNILYLTFFPWWEVMQPTLSHHFFLLHAPHALDHNCTCQNNPSLGFFGMSNICMHFHLSVCTWWCGRFFFSSLHTIILCMFAHLIDHLTHHHSSQFSLYRWWCRKFFFFLHTTIGTCHPISLIHIHHNFHPIVRCSFMCTKLSAPISKEGQVY